MTSCQYKRILFTWSGQSRQDHRHEIDIMNAANIALDMANAQIEAGWVEVDEDQYEMVEARLAMVSTLIKDAEKALAKAEKERLELYRQCDALVTE